MPPGGTEPRDVMLGQEIRRPRTYHRAVGDPRFGWEASEWPTFLHLDIVDEEWSDLGLEDDGLRELKSAILASPERHPVIAGTGGLRTIRFAPSRESRGKRAADRVGHVRFREFGFILPVTVCGNSDKSDLSATDRNALAAVVRGIRRALEARGGR